MLLKSKFIILFFSFFFSFSFSIAQNAAFPAGKISPYTAHLLYSINEAGNDSTNLLKNQRRFGIKRSGKQQYISAYIEFEKYEEKSVVNNLGKYNVKVNSVIGNVLTAEIPVESIEEISLLPNVIRVEIGIPVLPLMDKARLATKVEDVQKGIGLEMPYKGEGVVIGIIDGGFEYGHINFYNSDHTELRVKRVWNQNIRDYNNLTVGSTHGKEYKTQDEILYAATDRPSETHGTHVAGIAAGADYSNGNLYYGVAPAADLVFVSYSTSDNSLSNVSITDGINYIYNYADAIGKPCVINMSLGVHVGPHDGTSTFDRTSDELQGEGKLLVGAVGNEGNNNLHISKTFTTEDNVLQTSISFYNNSKQYSYCDIWSDADKTFSVQAVIYNTLTKQDVYTTNALNANTSHYIVFSLTDEQTQGATGTIQIYTEKNSHNKKPNALVVVDLNSLKPYHIVGLRITSTDGTVHAWTDSSYSYFSGNNQSNWIEGDGEYSMGEIGGTGKRIISVGAYTTNSSYSGGTLNNIAGFSSKGPTPDGRVKPEITAPGSAIVSSFSNTAVENGSYASKIVKTTDIDGTNYYYGYMQGTSMSAPHVTGILATWLQAKNNLSPEEAKRTLKKTAIQDDYTGAIPSAGSNVWGYGKINALAGIQECLELKNIEYNNPDKKIIIYKKPDEKNLSVVFPEDDKNIQISILCINKTMSFYKIDSIYKNQIISLDLSNYRSGVYFIYVKGNNKTYKVEKFIVN